MRVNFKSYLNTACITSLIFISSMYSSVYANSTAYHYKKHKAKHLELYQPAETTSHWFFGVGGGNTWVNLPNSTTVNNGSGATPPSDVDNFSIKSFNTGSIQFMLGDRWHRDTHFLPYYSTYLQYRHNFAANIKGIINQYSLPGFDNYNYKLRNDSDLFTINGKFDLFQFKQLLPYVMAGGGVIVNHFYDYTETATPGVTSRISPNYNGTQTSLAVTLGLGFDYILMDSLWLTLGYDHVFQSHLKTGPGIGSWSGTALNLGNTQMDTVFVSITTDFSQVKWK